ncbi:MAG: Panacea domain-containing protein [Pseudomonadota bacterium]
MEFNYDKLRDATHYICARANELGLIVDDIQLNKVLWYADALAYATRGQSITGTRYKRKPRGPVASGHLKSFKELVDNELIREGHVEREGRFIKILDSIRPPDTSRFGKAELKLIDGVLRHIATRLNTLEISEQSHGEIWRLARKNEEIPMYTVFAENIGEPSSEEIADAQRGV